jgi:superfamily I DNA/RNA helicase
MAATGLERPIVFLLGADDLFDTEEDPRLSPEEKREKIRDHTRLIYVALTRAMERLVIFTREQDRWIRCEEAAALPLLTG